MIRSHRSGRLRILASALSATLIAGGATILAAAPAHAEPVTVTDPASGVSITLSSDQILPGERIQISGTGFVPTQGSSGDPLVAVRPYDFDDGPAWTIGGQDAYFPVDNTVPPGSEAKYWFVTDHTTTSFEGWIQAPAGLTKAGPTGTGKHWLRILSGAYFTTTGDRLTDPITFEVPFTVVGKLETGMTGPTGTYQAGTRFRPGASVTLSGRGYTPNAALTVTLDGAVLPSTITTTADGAIPSTARVNMPTPLSVGAHTLTAATGAISNSVTITGAPVPTAVVPTTTIRSGGTIAYDLAGYLGVAGAPQKIAVVVDEQVLRCITASATGSASGAIAIPETADPTESVRFNVGTSCVLPPAAVINDLPISTSPHTLTISADAPELTVDGEAAPGGQFSLAGSGFDAGSSVAITVGTTAAGTLTANGSGEISGNVPAPATSGEVRVVAIGGSKAAATLATVTPKTVSEVSLSAPKPLAYGAKRTTTVALEVAGSPASGPVEVTQGSWSKTVDVTAGGTEVALPRDARVGEHTVTATYAGTTTIADATASQTFQVTKAAANASLKLAKGKVKRSARAAATIKVSIKGAPASLHATGKVTVYDGKKKLSTYQLKAKHKGVLKVKLPKIKKKGSHKLKAEYAGNADVGAKTSKPVTLKVV